ncbi:MAG: FHA domain-containing protein [Chloroflexota bacterium]
MAYGRLDVYWPNGEFNSFLLETPSVSVGRSSGCTIVLETDTISRYHLSIRRENGHTYIADMDSANGTYVDGVRLQADESRELYVGEELQIGHLRMIFFAEDDQPTMPLDRLVEDTQRFEKEDIGIRVAIFEPDTGVPPGAHKSIDIDVTNTTDETRVYTVGITGLPTGWGRVNRPRLRVDAGETAQVVLSVKPPRRSDAAPGDYPLTITIAYEDDPDKKVEASATARIQPFSAFAVGLVTRKVSLYNRFHLIMANRGSVALPVHVSGTSENDVLAFEIPQPAFTLAPGEQVEIKGSITPRRRRLFGVPVDQTFDLLVRSRDEAGFLTAVRGHFIDEAVLPRWAAYATGGLALAVIALLIAGLALIFSVPAPAPEIISIQSDQDQITSGTPLMIEWEATNVDRFAVRVNGDPVVVDLPGTMDSVTLDTTIYADQTMQIELQAFNDNSTAPDTAQVSVNVVRGLELVNFEIVPDVLVRNVIATVTVRWQVDGAIETEVQGVESIRRAADVPVEFETSYGPRAEFTVEGYVTDNFSITLLALDRLNNTQTWTRNVDVADPVCAVNIDELQVYERPTTAANVVATYTDRGASLVVDRIDPSRQWLRVRLSGGQTGWGARTDMTCADNFSPDNLLIEVVESPVTSTPPFTVTPSPAATDPAVGTPSTTTPTPTEGASS